MRVRLKTLGYFDKDAAAPGAHAFGRFFSRHFPAVKRYLTRFVSPADAEELAQEAFVRVYTGDAARIDSPVGFLFQTARNLAISHLRHRKIAAVAHAKEAAGDTQANEIPTAEDDLSRRQDMACARAAIAGLPERRREIFLMRMQEGLSYAEIAEKAGISLKSVESHLARGVEACQDFFEQCSRHGCAGKCRTGGGR